jgi:hypothetical protein
MGWLASHVVNRISASGQPDLSRLPSRGPRTTLAVAFALRLGETLPLVLQDTG